MRFPRVVISRLGRIVDILNLCEDEVSTVLGYTRWRRYARGELAIRAGEEERSLYIVTAGRFEVWIASPGGRRRAELLHPGDLFGELAFFDGQPRSPDVEATEDSEARVMTPADFDRLRLIPIAREGGSEAGASRHGLSGVCPTHVRHLLARLVSPTRAWQSSSSWISDGS